MPKRFRSKHLGWVFLLAFTGCAITPSMPDAQAVQSTDQARREQLLAIADKYEKSGRLDAAKRIHEYVAKSFPENAPAAQAPAAAPAMNAQAAEQPVIAKNAPPAAGAQPAAVVKPPVAAKPPVAETAPVVVAKVETPPKAETKPAAPNVPESKPSADELAAQVRKQNADALRKAMAEVAETKARESASQFADTAFTAPAAEAPIAKVSVTAAPGFPAELKNANAETRADESPAWLRETPPQAAAHVELPNKAPIASAPATPGLSGALLMQLCDQLPADLLPAVVQLADPSPAIRVEGLLDMCARKDKALPARIAIHALLRDVDPVVTVYAAGTLYQVSGDTWDSVRVLSAGLKHHDDRVVRLSSYLLGEMGPAAMNAAKDLELLRDSGRGITSLHAAEALTRIAPDDYNSVAMLNSALQSDRQEARWFAATSLGSVQGACAEDAALALVAALHDQDAGVRKAACLSLAGLGSAARIAIPDLRAMASNDTADLRAVATTALQCLQ